LWIDPSTHPCRVLGDTDMMNIKWETITEEDGTIVKWAHLKDPVTGVIITVGQDELTYEKEVTGPDGVNRMCRVREVRQKIATPI
jgi:hypothetical protein